MKHNKCQHCNLVCYGARSLVIIPDNKWKSWAGGGKGEFTIEYTQISRVHTYIHSPGDQSLVTSYNTVYRIGDQS